MLQPVSLAEIAQAGAEPQQQGGGGQHQRRPVNDAPDSQGGFAGVRLREASSDAAAIRPRISGKIANPKGVRR